MYKSFNTVLDTAQAVPKTFEKYDVYFNRHQLKVGISLILCRNTEAPKPME